MRRWIPLAMVVLAAAVLSVGNLVVGEGDDEPSGRFVPAPTYETTVYGVPLRTTLARAARLERYSAEDVAVDGDRVWVLGDNRLSSLDPESGAVPELARFRAERTHAVEAAGGALWVLGTTDERTLLFRVDPRTGRQREIDLGGGRVDDPALAATEDAVFVVNAQRRDPLLRVDARSGRVRTLELPAGAGLPSTLAASGGELWVTADRPRVPAEGRADVLLRLDPRTGAPRAAPLPGRCFDAIAVDADALWASLPCSDELLRISLRDGSRRVLRSNDADAETIAAGGGRVWLHESSRLVTATLGEPLLDVQLPLRELGGMEVAGALWLAAGTGVLRLQPADTSETVRRGLPAAEGRPTGLPVADELALGVIATEEAGRGICEAVRETGRDAFRRDPSEVALAFAGAELEWFAAAVAGVRRRGARRVVTVTRSRRRGAPRVELTAAVVPGARDCWWIVAAAPPGDGREVRATTSGGRSVDEFNGTVELEVEPGDAAAVDGTAGFGGRRPQGLAPSDGGTRLVGEYRFELADFDNAEGSRGALRAFRDAGDLTGHYLVRFLDDRDRVVTARGALLRGPGRGG